MIGAAVVTIPSCAYLLQPDPNKGHGHGHGHGHDEGEHSDHEEDAKGDDEAEAAPESETGQAGGEEDGVDQSSDNAPQGEGADERASDDRPRPDHSVKDAAQGSPDETSDEDPKAGAYEVDSGNNVEGVRFKGATSGGTEEGVQGDTRKYIPDAKGGYKHRIESHYAKEQGVMDGEDQENQGTEDQPAASKSSSPLNSQSAKQHGLSNTQTKHSTDISNDPDKSKKGEGYAETAKAMGTVDPGRRQVRSLEKVLPDRQTD
ncbi:MAG: hypothetical protein Q9174_001620 [Haloplaca sp. 1 TL-2023]